MNHRPSWISNLTEPSPRIFNSSDWQDSSFLTLARLMISKTFSGFSRSALKMFSRSPMTRNFLFAVHRVSTVTYPGQQPQLAIYKLFTKRVNAVKITFDKRPETNPY